MQICWNQSFVFSGDNCPKDLKEKNERGITLEIDRNRIDLIIDRNRIVCANAIG